MDVQFVAFNQSTRVNDGGVHAARFIIHYTFRLHSTRRRGGGGERQAMKQCRVVKVKAGGLK